MSQDVRDFALHLLSDEKAQQWLYVSVSLVSAEVRGLADPLGTAEQTQRPPRSRCDGSWHHSTDTRCPRARPFRKPSLLPRPARAGRWRRGCSINFPSSCVSVALLPCLPNACAGREEQDAQLLSGLHQLSIDGWREGATGTSPEGA